MDPSELTAVVSPRKQHAMERELAERQHWAEEIAELMAGDVDAVSPDDALAHVEPLPLREDQGYCSRCGADSQGGDCNECGEPA